MTENNAVEVCGTAGAENCAAHTPGPWSTDGRGGIEPDDELIITGAVTRYGPGFPAHTRLAAVALVERSCNEAEDYANARLIAAAPELLAALLELLPLAEALADRDAGDGYEDEEDQNFGLECESAIAKAIAVVSKCQG